MDKKTLVTMVGALVFLIILVVAIDTLMGGLPGSIVEVYNQEQSGIDEAYKNLASNKSAVASLVNKDKSFLSPIEKRENWSGKQGVASTKLDEAKKNLETNVAPLIEKNSEDDYVALKTALSNIRGLRISALKASKDILTRADKLTMYKAKRPQLVKDALDCYKSIDMAKAAAIKIKADQAIIDWPEKKIDIEKRMGVFDSIKKSADESHSFIVEENKKPEDQIDFDALVSRDEILEQSKVSFENALVSIPELLEQLYHSWDKVLEDMEIVEGYEVDFYHYYKIVKVNKNNEALPEERQKSKISKTLYLRHENNLGMVLESKPTGKYDFEVDTQTSPPGYNYVGNSRYGQWKRDSHGSSFWVFYGQYHFMRSMFWGSSYYSPIYRNDWNNYHQYRNSGRTYYGRDRAGKTIYGSKGSLSKSKYSGSKYTSKKGFSSSKFKQSKGAYKGSRYATKSRSSSSRSFSSGSRSSRSSGGK